MALTRTVGFQGIWLLIYVSGLMFVMRHFAGPLSHKLSPVGLLWFSCLLAAAGLVLLSMANSGLTGLLAATIWGAGVCFMWPTMLAAASERFPRGGALLMGLMGTAGTLAIYFVLPKMGEIFDNAKIATAGGESRLRDAVRGGGRGRRRGQDPAQRGPDRRLAVLVPVGGHPARDPAPGLRGDVGLRPDARRLPAGRHRRAQRIGGLSVSLGSLGTAGAPPS